VQTTTGVSVHSAASNFSTPLGPQPLGATGRILASPGTLDPSGDNTIYWQVAFDNGPTGWVSGVFLAPFNGPGNWYVSPSATGSGDGSQGSPWTLQKAFDPANAQLQPGDVVWLLPGTYGTDTDFTADKSGAAGNPITYREHSSGHAKIDGRIRVHGNYLTFRGFEVMQSNPAAHIAAPWYGIESFGHDLKYINLVIHDASASGIIVYWPTGPTEVYGSIIYNNGVDSSLAHGIFVQNTDVAGIARIEENVMFDNAAYGIYSYTDGNTLRNIQLVRNVSFNNGSTANPAWGYNQKANLLVSGIVGGATAIRVDSNYLFEQNSTSYELVANLKLGSATLNNADFTLRNNTVWGGRSAVLIYDWTNGTVSGNTLRGGVTNNQLVDKSVEDIPLTGYTWTGDTYYAPSTSLSWWYNGGWLDLPTWQNSTHTGLSNSGTAASLPGSATTFLRVNKYDPTRALLVVFNWTGGAVTASLGGFLVNGQPYSIRNVQNIYGTPVATGTYNGTAVTVPMTGTTPPPLSGHGWSANGPTTGPYFHAFIVTTP